MMEISYPFLVVPCFLQQGWSSYGMGKSNETIIKSSPYIPSVNMFFIFVPQYTFARKY